MARLRARQGVNLKYYVDARNRFIEDVKKNILEDSAKAGITFEERGRIRKFAASYVILGNLFDKEKEGLLAGEYLKKDMLGKDFFGKNQTYFSFLSSLRRFFSVVLFGSRFFSYIFSMFVFFLFEFIWHYYPPFTNIHFEITVVDIVKFFPPFF